MVVGGPPTVRSTTEMSESTGARLPLIVKGRALDVPPPGVGVNTLTAGIPGCERSLTGIAADNWVPVTKVVGCATPFQRTTEPATKLLPFTCSVRVGLLMSREFGEIEVISGTGLPPGINVNFATNASKPPAFL